MKKLERVYRQILYTFLEKKENKFTQKALSEICNIPISNVNHALKPLREINAISISNMGFKVIDAKKILVYWASIRNLRKDVIYETFVEMPIIEIEKSLPPIIFTAYSAFKQRFGNTVSDYGEVVVYGNKKIIEKRFQKNNKPSNLIILKEDSDLKRFKEIPLAQIYVDLWNLNKWYAYEFLKALEMKIDGILE